MNNEQQQYKYFAFISYNSHDAKEAFRLHRKLEHYSLPTDIAKEHSYKKRPVDPVFFAETDILPGNLNPELESRLESSRFLIVVCSPNSAQSKWVGKEIEYFISLGRKNQILLFIVDGVPGSGNPETECFHPVIQEHLTMDYLGANIHEASVAIPKRLWRERAYTQIVSKMLGLNFDDLWQRQKRRLRRLAFLWTLFAVCLFAGVSFVICRNLPFAAKITLEEDMSRFNAKLPGLKMASVKLYLDNDTIVKDIDSTTTFALFQNIPSKYRSQKVHVVVESWPYDTLDTNLCLNNSLSLRIKLSDYYQRFEGFVRSGDKMLVGVKGVKVDVGGNVVYTDSTGHFSVDIPEDQWAEMQPVKLYKKGYCSDLDSEEHRYYPNRKLEFRMYKR